MISDVIKQSNYFDMRILLSAFIFVSFFANAQDVKVLKYDEFQAYAEKQTDKLLVVNFWATWCAPCIKELPHFMEVNSTYSENPGFEMVLVSLDKTDHLPRVKNFLTKRNITVKSFLLEDAGKAKEWMPKFDTKWGGSIPATIFYKNGKKVAFVEGELSKDKLVAEINKNL